MLLDLLGLSLLDLGVEGGELGIDSLKVSLEDLGESDFESDPEEDLVLRPSEPPASNPRWVPCDHLSNNGK